jgi:hypothetical protein
VNPIIKPAPHKPELPIRERSDQQCDCFETESLSTISSAQRSRKSAKSRKPKQPVSARIAVEKNFPTGNAVRPAIIPRSLAAPQTYRANASSSTFAVSISFTG